MAKLRSRFNDLIPGGGFSGAQGTGERRSGNFRTGNSFDRRLQGSADLLGNKIVGEGGGRESGASGRPSNRDP